MKNISKRFFDRDKLIIRTLDKDALIKYFDDILMIDTISLGHFKLWSKENFFLDYPAKWILSKIALLNNKPIGYCIASLYCNNKAHIHRISIYQQFRGKGVGESLVYQVSVEASCKGIVTITLESLRENFIATQFYKKLGFKELNENEVKKYLIDKKKMIKSNEFYALNKTGNRLVLSINDLKTKSKKLDRCTGK